MLQSYILFFLLLLSLPFSAYSQHSDKTDIYIGFEAVNAEAEIHFSYLLADSVSLRECPSSVCRFLGVLRASTKLTILERSDEVEKIKGIKSHWYKIKTNSEDTVKIGWIWGGFIAQAVFKSEEDLDVKFLLGLHQISYKNINEKGFEGAFKYKIKAMKDTTLIDEMFFNIHRQKIFYLIFS